ncbi:MAG: hypothetical protein GX554_03035 [Elusimicrobia bacterium]|nr:hypothetical protein [Elusimicrobiota bacterium]
MAYKTRAAKGVSGESGLSPALVIGGENQAGGMYEKMACNYIGRYGAGREYGDRLRIMAVCL